MIREFWSWISGHASEAVEIEAEVLARDRRASVDGVKLKARRFEQLVEDLKREREHGDG